MFETFKVVNGIPLFLEDHCNRLQSGISYLGLVSKTVFNAATLKPILRHLLVLNNCLNARVRLTVFRSGNSLYFPDSNQISWHLSCSKLEDTGDSLLKHEIKLGWFSEEVKSPGKLSNLKTLNGLIYILAANFAVKHGFDDVLINNSNGDFIESIHSNLFILKDNILFTPPLSDGCLEGVMRKNLIQMATSQGFICNEVSIGLPLLENADEILLTNVIRGVQSVKHFNGKVYANATGIKLNSGILHHLR
ncbi:MAG: aminotransferase class IV [Bacteroidetes bacterium]|nr:aminotransferase class IV [Bacteroidota bacterium]